MERNSRIQGLVFVALAGGMSNAMAAEQIGAWSIEAEPVPIASASINVPNHPITALQFVCRPDKSLAYRIVTSGGAPAREYTVYRWMDGGGTALLKPGPDGFLSKEGSIAASKNLLAVERDFAKDKSAFEPYFDSEGLPPSPPVNLSGFSKMRARMLQLCGGALPAPKAESVPAASQPAQPGRHLSESACPGKVRDLVARFDAAWQIQKARVDQIFLATGRLTDRDACPGYRMSFEYKVALFSAMRACGVASYGPFALKALPAQIENVRRIVTEKNCP